MVLEGFAIAILLAREIEYFLVVAQEGNITTAAQRLHMAQPPLSRQMKQLEEKLGAKLFERGARKIQLTEAGQLLRSRAEQMLTLMDVTAKEIRDIETGAQGTLSIGTTSSSGATILPKVAHYFRKHYPNVNFELWEGESSRIIELLSSGLIEIGLVRFSFDTDTYESIQLEKVPMVAAVRNNSQYLLSGEQDVIPLAELANKPLMIHRRYETLLTEYCQQAGFNPHFLCKSDDIMPVIAWTDADVGVAVIPRSAIGLIPGSNITYKTIVHPSIETSSSIIWMRSRPLSTPARHFLTTFIELSQGK